MYPFLLNSPPQERHLLQAIGDWVEEEIIYEYFMQHLYLTGAEQ